ncbi:hypothetical protein ACFSSA_12575 [Luteolibacter algae]|uniref:Lambda-carrageenase n=1 Tax=Luteolibacter algae TaxID=454151 RepID=A0ABW5D9N1_9BACT
MNLSPTFAAALFLLSPSLYGGDFATDLNGLRCSAVTEIDGKPALFLSELSGGVAAYSMSGEKLWENKGKTPAVLFEIEAADIDNDGVDELLGASGDGNIHCWGNDGTPRWSFNPGHKVRFSEIAVVENGGESRIFAGGNDFHLYELDKSGKQLSATKIEGTVRKLEAGNFIEKDRQSLFVMTYRHDKFRWKFMGILNPETKEVLAEVGTNKLPSKNLGKMMLTDFDVADIDKDGLEDLLFFGDDSKAVWVGLNGKLEAIAEFTGSPKDKQRYAHVTGASLLPVRDEIALQFGGFIYLCDLNGNLIKKVGERHRGIVFSDFTLEPKTKQLVAAGEVDGGNGVYLYPLAEDNWLETSHSLLGRMATVEKNLEILYRQTLAFKLPEYQKRSEKPWVMLSSNNLPAEVENLDGAEMAFANQIYMQEKSDRKELVAAIGEVALKKDKRMSYSMTREEIVALARKMEAEGTPFTAWTGHGNDPFITSIDTMEAVLEAAPNTCYGFVYAEMANTEDPRVHHFINEYVPRLATAMRKHGKAKLYFRYKNIFWAATSHLEPWKDLFFPGKYSDVLVPSAEDTNSRAQELNFAGRVGMLAGGYIEDFAMRLVDDNPTCWRPLSPGGQRSVSPYLRNGALLAAYGSRYGLIFNIAYLEDPGMNTLYALMKSGVLPVVNKEDILSIGAWQLIKDPDHRTIERADDGHNLELYTPDDENAVFSIANVDCCGASLPEHDFSKVALGVDYRWLNFMPTMPYGMVPVAAVESAPELEKAGTPFTITDTKSGFLDGVKIPAKEFGKTIRETVQAGAKKMPVLVSGASWSAIRLDDNHTRLVLIDPGYLDPQERDVTVTFQGKQPTGMRDILSNEEIEVGEGPVKLVVPAGSMRFIDLTYAK